tara:strand:- start:448 stop:570 length:123 start_codon:yes stop_codon:yes gene_type:complete
MPSSKKEFNQIIEEIIKLKLEKQTDDVKLRIQKLQQQLSK